MIVFSKLRWRNLLSTGNQFTEITLNTHRHTLIVGENGAGKSTILDALSFALYGKAFRKINKGQLINSINNKGLLVECEFAVGSKTYLVRRGAKPSVFEIYQNGTLLNPDASSDDYQQMLDKQILKINHKSFSQIVVLGSASFVPFMQLTAANRREVIEDLLDIQIFSTMNVLLKDKVLVNKVDITDADYHLKSITEKIELEKKHIEEVNADKEQHVIQKRQQIQQINQRITLNQQKVSSLQQQCTIYDQTAAKHTKLVNRKSKVVSLQGDLSRKIHTFQKDIYFLANHDNCPVCKQGIDLTFKNNEINTKQMTLQEIEQAINTLDQELQNISTEIDKVQVDIAKQAELNNTIAFILQQINIDISVKQNLEKDIEQLNNNTSHVDVKITRLNELKTQLKEKIALRTQLSENRAVLEAASVLLKDSGIKTKIIRQYIPVINKLINKYLAAMDFFVNFEIDENFEEKIKSRFRDEFSYASFSEGEKSRLDLALLFTWRSISKLRNSMSTNLLILDEVFDGSLDSQGNEELLKIIQTLTEGNNVFVISHKTDAYLDKFERVLRFEKQKNFSRMVES